MAILLKHSLTARVENSEGLRKEQIQHLVIKEKTTKKKIILQRAGPRLTYLQGRDCVNTFFGLLCYMAPPPCATNHLMAILTCAIFNLRYGFASTF